MMRKFIDTKLDDDDVRHVYLPYEDFQIIDNQGVNLESPYLRHMVSASLTLSLTFLRKNP